MSILIIESGWAASDGLADDGSHLRHHDDVLGTLRAAGFSLRMAAHAYSLLDAYIYGFAMTEATLPFDGAQEMTTVAQSMLDSLPGHDYPNLAELITGHAMQPGYDYGSEFEYGLDIVLDGIERDLAGSA